MGCFSSSLLTTKHNKFDILYHNSKCINGKYYCKGCTMNSIVKGSSGGLPGSPGGPGDPWNINLSQREPLKSNF